MRIRWRNFELPSKVVPDAETMTAEYGRFVIEPFERGFGHTIGNGLPAAGLWHSVHHRRKLDDRSRGASRAEGHGDRRLCAMHEACIII